MKERYTNTQCITVFCVVSDQSESRWWPHTMPKKVHTMARKHRNWIMGQCKRVALSMKKSSRSCLGLQILQISIRLSINGMCWTSKSHPWRPQLKTYRTAAGSAANILMPNIIGQIQRSCGAHASMHQSCFGSKSFKGHLIYEINSIWLVETTFGGVLLVPGLYLSVYLNPSQAFKMFLLRMGGWH